MDHLMRQYPSEHMRTIKRNFYPADGKWIELDEMVHVRKGTYSAFRFGEVSILTRCPFFSPPGNLH